MSTQNPKTAGLVTIKYVVSSILNRLQDYSYKQYKRLVQIAIEGFSEEFSIFHINAGSDVVYLHMSTAKTVPLPADFIDFVKIGYPVNGKLRIITNNEAILLPRTWDDGDGSEIGNYYGQAIGEDEISSVICFPDHYKNGAFVGGMYGLPGGTDNCYYRIDRENRKIVFSGSTPRSEICLEYISTGLKNDATSLIPREVVAPLRAYVLWQMVANDSRVAYNEKERLKREFTELTEALRSFSNSFTAEEYLSMFYSTVYQAPRR